MFYGVPYALPPTGPRRWRKPQALPKDHHYGNLDCSDRKTYCPQPRYTQGGQPILCPEGVPSEDCLRVDIWLPVAAAPPEGWPVYCWCHGGWMQIGSSLLTPHHLFSKGGLQAIIVSINYRLNVFGFLRAGGVDTNLGLYDQRFAMEWTRDHCHLFGGNADNITLGGLSAGAYSTQCQLIYDLLVSPKPMVRRAVMQSNAIPFQPKHPSLLQSQFAELCALVLGDAASDETAASRVERMRQVPADVLVQHLHKLPMFRPVVDEVFLPSNIMQLLHGGDFGRRFVLAGMSLMIGEVENEESLYAKINPPQHPRELVPSLCNYYPRKVVDSLVAMYPPLAESADAEECERHFGRIVSDVQVRTSIRGFVQSLLLAHVPLSRIHRYRIGLRLQAADQLTDPSYGVGHGDDSPIWWYHDGLSQEEEQHVRRWLTWMQRFLDGRELDWGCDSVDQYRLLDKGGERIQTDASWDEFIKISRMLRT